MNCSLVQIFPIGMPSTVSIFKSSFQNRSLTTDLVEKLLVGIASAIESEMPTVLGCFTPQPNYTYHLKPSSVFHVTSGSNFNVGALVPVELLGNTVAMNFDSHPTNAFTVVHNPDLNFELTSIPPSSPKLVPTSPTAVPGLPSVDHGGYYSITIQNKSGIPQDYALYNEPPTVKPPPNGLTSRAILVAHGVVPGSGTAYMTVPKDEFFALSGSGYQDGAVQNFNLDRKPVKLGSVSSSRIQQVGTNCVLAIKDKGPPSFVSGEGLLKHINERASFSVQTGDDFTYEEAKNSASCHIPPIPRSSG